MKKSITLFLFTAIIFLGSTAFMNYPIHENSKATPVEPAVYKVMEVAYLWNLLVENYQPNYDRDQTWLRVGFRSKYAMAKNYASLALLEKAFDEKIFIEGPHGKDMNFNSTTSFGHYNPAFLNKLHDAIKTALEYPLYRSVASQLYHGQLRSMARTYYNTHEYTYKNPDLMKQIKTDYLAAMKQKGGTYDGSLQETFRAYAEAAEQNQASNIYEAFTAPAFWLRRDIDGTDEIFIEILELVINELE